MSCYRWFPLKNTTSQEDFHSDFKVLMLQSLWDKSGGQPKAISENVSIQRGDQGKQMEIVKKKIEVIQVGLDALTLLQRKIIEVFHWVERFRNRRRSKNIS